MEQKIPITAFTTCEGIALNCDEVIGLWLLVWVAAVCVDFDLETCALSHAYKCVWRKKFP